VGPPPHPRIPDASGQHHDTLRPCAPLRPFRGPDRDAGQRRTAQRPSPSSRATHACWGIPRRAGLLGPPRASWVRDGWTREPWKSVPARMFSGRVARRCGSLHSGSSGTSSRESSTPCRSGFGIPEGTAEYVAAADRLPALVAFDENGAEVGVLLHELWCLTSWLTGLSHVMVDTSGFLRC
jgi:hypothetical protein